ncbi:MAG: hypothetical protein KDA65_01325 [Planctomycetaceae bacterium]|nr:hypothetical protein [Planctomycetaceae bacterium]
MLRHLRRRSVFSLGLIGLLAIGLATPSQACCFFNWFQGWGHSSYYRGATSYYAPASPCCAPACAPSGCGSCGSCGYGVSGCASGNCGVGGSCGTESTTYESPATGQSNKEPVNPDEMEPVRSRSETESSTPGYGASSEPDISNDPRWEGTNGERGRDNFRGDLNRGNNETREEEFPNLNFNSTEPSTLDGNAGSETSPSLGNSEFNPNLNESNPSAEPALPEGGAPNPRDREKPFNINDNLFNQTNPDKDTEIERSTAKPVAPVEGEGSEATEPESANTEAETSEPESSAAESTETEATETAPAEDESLEAPLSDPEEIESSTDSELKKEQEESSSDERSGLRPLNLDNQFSLHTPLRTRLNTRGTSTVEIPELVRKPVQQRTVTKTKTKSPRLVSR